MDDDERFERLCADITRIEVLVKAHLIEQVETLGGGRDKIAAMTAVSMGLSAAAIHAAIEGYEQTGDTSVPNLTLGLFQEAVAPELQRLVNIMKGEK